MIVDDRKQEPKVAEQKDAEPEEDGDIRTPKPEPSTDDDRPLE